jgi:hypothetical protein
MHGPEAAKKDPSRLGSGQEVRPFAVVRKSDERNVIYDKSVLHCEDQRIGILIFCAECCGLATERKD